MKHNDWQIDPQIQKFINEVVRPNVIAVREKLAKKYDVVDPESYNVNYNSLCIEASRMFVKRIKRYRKLNDISKLTLHVKTVHGEQKPHPRLKMKHWGCEHEWVVVTYVGVKIYVDVTCGQFVDFYRDVPDYYISTHPPKWFLPDKENPAINRPWNRRERIKGFFYDRIGQLLNLQVPEEKEDKDD